MFSTLKLALCFQGRPVVSYRDLTKMVSLGSSCSNHVAKMACITAMNTEDAAQRTAAGLVLGFDIAAVIRAFGDVADVLCAVVDVRSLPFP